jgi:HD superfamily phosphodiesterase
MTEFQALIHRLEQRWLQELYVYCSHLFQGVFLPSHDQEHHYRVWLNARQLATALHEQGSILSETMLEGLLFASFFHDTGMRDDPGAYHGTRSRELMVEYLEKKGINCETMLDAIVAVEKHDRKDYPVLPEQRHPATNLDTLLSVADDLDAFGTLGVLRYAEINLLRGNPTTNLAGIVLPDLEKRYSHFFNSYGMIGPLTAFHRNRYLITSRYFEDLAGALQEERNGILGVLSLFEEHVIKARESYRQAAKNILELSSDLYITRFYTRLLEELGN